MVQASAEKLEHTGPAEKERVALVPEAVGRYAGAALAKRERNRAVSPEVPDRKAGESQGESEPHLSEKERESE